MAVATIARRQAEVTQHAMVRPGRGDPGRTMAAVLPTAYGTTRRHPKDRVLSLASDPEPDVALTGSVGRSESSVDSVSDPMDVSGVTGAGTPGTAVSRPAATAAISTMTTPRPVKNPSCSATCLSVVVAAGTPAGLAVVHSGASTLPTANHAPATMPRKAPNSARCLAAVMISSTPPRSATA